MIMTVFSVVKASGCVLCRAATKSNTAHSPSVVQHNSPTYCKRGSTNVETLADRYKTNVTRATVGRASPTTAHLIFVSKISRPCARLRHISIAFPNVSPSRISSRLAIVSFAKVIMSATLTGKNRDAAKTYLRVSVLGRLKIANYRGNIGLEFSSS